MAEQTSHDEYKALMPTLEQINAVEALAGSTTDEKHDLVLIENVRNKIAESRGVLSPRMNAVCYNLVASVYSRVTARVGRYKAMRNEYYAKLLLADPDIKIGRAKAIAEGSNEGMAGKYYENVAVGIEELTNALKKTQEHLTQEMRNYH